MKGDPMQPMTPSKTDTDITPGEIAKIQELLGAGLRKSGLQNEPTQKVLQTQGKALAVELVAVVRKFVEAMANMLVRLVHGIDPAQTNQEALNATGRTQYVNPAVVASAPRGENGKVFLWKPDSSAYDENGCISDERLAEEYRIRGQKPAGLVLLAKMNQDDPALADTHPHGTHWKDADGKWCFAAFYGWGGERFVDVDRDVHDWSDVWWFAGVLAEEAQ